MPKFLLSPCSPSQVPLFPGHLLIPVEMSSPGLENGRHPPASSHSPESIVLLVCLIPFPGHQLTDHIRATKFHHPCIPAPTVVPSPPPALFVLVKDKQTLKNVRKHADLSNLPQRQKTGQKVTLASGQNPFPRSCLWETKSRISKQLFCKVPFISPGSHLTPGHRVT